MKLKSIFYGDDEPNGTTTTFEDHHQQQQQLPLFEAAEEDMKMKLTPLQFLPQNSPNTGLLIIIVTNIIWRC
jgi:hypothetical protein